MTKKASKSPNRRLKRIYKGFFLAFLGLILLFSIIFTVGLIPYYNKWRECGKQPVVMSREIAFDIEPSSSIPEYSITTEPTFTERSFTAPTFCSIEQAKASVDGYARFTIN